MFNIEELFRKELRREEVFNLNTSIWVIHADKIPPHIGISTEGLFYSLKSGGKDERLPTSKLLNILDKKKITVLVVELKSNIQIESIELVFKKYQRTEHGKVTCLAPLKEILKSPYADKVMHLIAELGESEQIKTIHSLNLPDDYNGIPPYDISDIHKRLKFLDAKS